VRLTRGILAAVVAVAVCVLVVALIIARNMMLDNATSGMKTGEFGHAATKLKLLANLGDSTAQSLLGDLYAYGWGLSKDDETAVYWYRRTGTPEASVSDPAAPAMHYVGRKYLGGEGIPRDETEARKWFERSAKGGFAKANEDLVRMQ
jgi:uncharacterized protein